ncbi:MAG TPA: acyltransferase [Longimicrobiales bacterium]|nr:acyltransferase [Longimicrobiales bacterium]
MAFLPLRSVPLPSAFDAELTGWLDSIERALDDPATDRNDLCRTILTDLHYPEIRDEDLEALPTATRLAVLQLDPRNVTLEPEYYSEIDVEAYARVKPLIWLWEGFDRSALGENVEVGVRFRRLLAKRIFRRCGRNFKAFHQVKLSFGYNLEVGDNVVVHRHVLLDDRGGIEIGDGASISDYVNVYSHSHDIVDGREVFTPKTVVGAGARITYHATILAGTTVAPDSMVGAGSMLTRSTEPHTVWVGVPARQIRTKDLDRRETFPPRTGDPLADGTSVDVDDSPGDD